MITYVHISVARMNLVYGQVGVIYFCKLDHGYSTTLITDSPSFWSLQIMRCYRNIRCFVSCSFEANGGLTLCIRRKISLQALGIQKRLHHLHALNVTRGLKCELLLAFNCDRLGSLSSAVHGLLVSRYVYDWHFWQFSGVFYAVAKMTLCDNISM